jgi:tetratricopeptide (TPR) repeat protein
MTKPNVSTAVLERISNDIARGLEAGHRGEHREALTTLHQVLGETKRLGLDAPDAHWGIAAAHDLLGEYADALHHIQWAVELDGLSPAYRRSLGIIVGHIREALLSDKRPLFDPETRGSYRLLQGANAADVHCHVRFGAFLVATKRYDEAREHLLAVAQLAPQANEAWVLLSQIAMATDDEVLASQCSSRVTEPPEPEVQGMFPQFTAAAG